MAMHNSLSTRLCSSTDAANQLIANYVPPSADSLLITQRNSASITGAEYYPYTSVLYHSYYSYLNSIGTSVKRCKFPQIATFCTRVNQLKHKFNKHIDTTNHVRRNNLKQEYTQMVHKGAYNHTAMCIQKSAVKIYI